MDGDAEYKVSHHVYSALSCFYQYATLQGVPRCSESTVLSDMSV